MKKKKENKKENKKDTKDNKKLTSKNTSVKKVKKKKKEDYSSSEVAFLSFMTLLLGLLLGVILCYSKVNLLDNSDSKLQEIISTYNDLVKNHDTKVDKDKLVNNAISGMLDSLDDPYQSFMDEKETETFKHNLDGYYHGYGITITQDCSSETNHIRIVDVFEDSPAELAGIKTGDIILRIDEFVAEDADLEDVIGYLDKCKDKEVWFTIKRDKETFTFKVKKSKVVIKSVHSEKIGDIGYINISDFASNTGEQFKEALKELKNNDINSLMIDLRDNNGGYISQTTEVLEPFFKKNTVLYKIESNNNISKVKATNNDSMDIPVVILINENTASASEIVASCFKENYANVKLVGKMTYGKGTIQKTVDLSTGSTIKYTTDKWLTSKGKWLNHDKNIGIRPDVEVTNDDSKDGDKQFNKGQELLTRK